MSPPLQLNPPIPVWTKKGTGVAHFLIDYGFYEHHLLWIVAMDDGGKVWGFENPDIRFTSNQTYGRTKDVAPSIHRIDHGTREFKPGEIHWVTDPHEMKQPMTHEEFTKLYGGE